MPYIYLFTTHLYFVGLTKVLQIWSKYIAIGN